MAERERGKIINKHILSWFLVLVSGRCCFVTAIVPQNGKTQTRWCPREVQNKVSFLVFPISINPQYNLAVSRQRLNNTDIPTGGGGDTNFGSRLKFTGSDPRENFKSGSDNRNPGPT